LGNTSEEENGLAYAEAAADYTYLTLPPDGPLRSCIGLVVAGLAARARIGVAGLEEAVELLESQHSMEGPTRYRFSIKDDGLVAEVEDGGITELRSDSGTGWRTVVEMVA
jgi:putative transcriptional regulator